jgi:hypothetical protein
VKREIQNEVRLPRSQLHLVFGVTHLNDESTLQDYSILANASVVLLETALQKDEMFIDRSPADRIADKNALPARAMTTRFLCFPIGSC